MLKQISVKSIKSKGSNLKSMYNEAQKYLENIGFKKTPLVGVTSKNQVFRSFLFAQGDEKVILEFKQDNVEEILKLIFEPLEIKFVYDILLMRFTQIAKEKDNTVFVYNS